MGVRCADPLHPLRAARRYPARCARGHALGRRAPPLRPRTCPHRHLGRAFARRAHQPPRHACHLLARRPSQAPLDGGGGCAARGHPRPLVPRRGLPEHVGGPQPHGRTLRGRVLRLHPATRRARPHRGGHGGASAEHAAQGAQLARPRCPSAHLEAQVQDRCRPCAARSRPARAQQRGAQAPRSLAPRQAGHRARGSRTAQARRACCAS